MRWHAIAVAMLLVLAVASCGKKNPTSPGMSSGGAVSAIGGASSARVAPAPTVAPASARLAPGQPGYEQAYVAGSTVTINAIEVPGKAPMQAQADFYEVVYPTDWQALGIPPPQCNPCDHDNNGIDAQDYHDHVLDSRPGILGYRAPWHVYAVVPAYNGDPTHDTAIDQVYKATLPIKSEDALNAFVASRLPSGAPIAVKIDTQFYFLCAVVNANAMK